MESVNKKVLLIALVLSLFTSILVYVYLSSASSKPAEIDYVNVYVAARTMPAKYKITDSDIKTVKTVKELLNSKAVLIKSEIIGKRLKESIIAGEEILSDRLIDEGKTILSFSMPEGKRALSINVNDQIAVSGLIRPGDFVDIIVSFEKEEVDNGTTTAVYPRITKTLLQNVEILALGQDQVVGDEKLKDELKTVTIAVNQDDVEKFVFASEYGVLRFSLRHADDSAIKDTQGVTREDVVTGKGAYTINSSNAANVIKSADTANKP